MATKIVKFVLLSHSALVNIRVRSTLRGSCPLRGTSSVKNVILNSNRLDDQGGVWQYNTLLSTLPPPPPPPSRARWGGNLSSLITNVVVVVVFSLLFSLPSQFSITWFFFLLEDNFKYINETCPFSPVSNYISVIAKEIESAKRGKPPCQFSKCRVT